MFCCVLPRTETEFFFCRRSIGNAIGGRWRGIELAAKYISAHQLVKKANQRLLIEDLGYVGSAGERGRERLVTTMAWISPIKSIIMSNITLDLKLSAGCGMG